MDHNFAISKSSTPLDARMLKTRAALRTAVLALLEEKPFEQVTIREIAVRADVGYATFFRHYQTKEELLHDIASAEISHLIGLALPAFNAVDTRAAAVTLCQHVDRHRILWSALLTGGAAGMMREEFIRQASEIKPQGSPDSWVPPELATIYGVSATVEILAWWLERGRGQTPDDIAGILDRLVIAPLIMPVAAKGNTLRKPEPADEV